MIKKTIGWAVSVAAAVMILGSLIYVAPAGADVTGHERVSSVFNFSGGVGLRSSHRVDCPTGKVVLGGGYNATDTYGTEVDVVASYPSSDSRWWVEFYPTDSSSQIVVWAVCGTPA